MTFKKELIENDNTGDLFVRYTPVVGFESHVSIRGELTFACWDVEVGAPKVEHETARAAATANVKKTLLAIANSL